MNFRKIGLVTVMALCGGISQASATIVDVTYTGIMTGGFDNAGVFGFAPGQDLTGLAYTASYTFDTNLGTDTTAHPFYSHQIIGFPGAALSASVAIDNGTPVSIGPISFSQIRAGSLDQLDAANSQYHEAQGTTPFVSLVRNSISNATFGSDLLGTIDVAFFYAVGDGDVTLADFNLFGNQAIGQANLLTLTYALSDVPQVPLPAALPLFASVLGLFGVARWRRKFAILRNRLLGRCLMAPA
jgi:hypothetical protein